MGKTLELERGVKILRHDTEGHFARQAVWHRPKGQAPRMFIEDVFPVPDFPVCFILNHRDQPAHSLHRTLPMGRKFPFSIGEKTVFLRKGYMAFDSRL